MLTSRTIKTIIDVSEYALEKYEERKKILLEQYLKNRENNKEINEEIKFIIEQQMITINYIDNWKKQLELRTEDEEENDIEI